MRKNYFLLLAVLSSFLSFAQSGGNPSNITFCADGPIPCYDLTVNTPNILGTLNPSEYTVSYHFSQGTAEDNIAPINSPHCTGATQITLYARLQNNATGAYTVSPAYVMNAVLYQNAPGVLPTFYDCDYDANGTINWDLTEIPQLNTGNAMVFYTNLANAQYAVSAIANPSAWPAAVTLNQITLYAREIIVGGCDIIHTVKLRGYSSCTINSMCTSAESLCNSFGVPFANTTSVNSTGSSNCLGSVPNPKWFNFQISSPGNLKLAIVQTSNNGNPLDVDYIVYGPFTNAFSACSSSSYLANNVASCSYSTAAVEYPVINNVQPGEYYLLLVTNFANQAGTITITQLTTSTGAIDCSGLKLNAFLDSNTNGIKDTGESDFPLGQFHYEKNDDGTVHHITAPTGIYNIYDVITTNSYDVSFTVDPSYAAMYNVVPAAYANLNVVSNSGLVPYYFPVTVVQPYTDLTVTVVPLNAPRPGFIYQNKIEYTNLGNQSLASGTLTFVKDANVTVTSNTQAGTTPTATGFTYSFTNLMPFETRSMTVSMQVPIIPTVVVGQILSNTASIEPVAGDFVPENNSNTSAEVVVNAYDPNDKMESHGGRILHSAFTSNDYLYYTIRFENTGTASAINILVNDVLDPKLDETSLKMVSSSHPYELDRVGANLNWKFDNILLPVSVSPDSSVGKGYITFKIKPKPGYAVGDIINNAASIYFDFNPAIVTNMFATEFVASLGVDQFVNDDFVFYPNPASDLVTISTLNTKSTIVSVLVYDIVGKTIATQKGNGPTTTIDVSHLNSGMYFVEVVTGSNLRVVKKLMIK